MLSLFSVNPFYGFSIIYINIYMYILTLYLLFSLLFLFDLKKIKTINSLKVFNKHNFLSMSVVLVFLSMAGIPPLIGFVGKFLAFNFLLLSQKYIYIIIFSFLNFFSIYFYIQNLRFLISKTQYDCFFIIGYYVFFNKKLINLLVLLNFSNFFSILYLEDFLYFFLSLVSCKSLY